MASVQVYGVPVLMSKSPSFSHLPVDAVVVVYLVYPCLQAGTDYHLPLPFFNWMLAVHKSQRLPALSVEQTLCPLASVQNLSSVPVQSVLTTLVPASPLTGSTEKYVFLTVMTEWPF